MILVPRSILKNLLFPLLLLSAALGEVDVFAGSITPLFWLKTDAKDKDPPALANPKKEALQSFEVEAQKFLNLASQPSVSLPLFASSGLGGNYFVSIDPLIAQHAPAIVEQMRVRFKFRLDGLTAIEKNEPLLNVSRFTFAMLSVGSSSFFLDHELVTRIPEKQGNLLLTKIDRFERLRHLLIHDAYSVEELAIVNALSSSLRRNVYFDSAEPGAVVKKIIYMPYFEAVSYPHLMGKAPVGGGMDFRSVDYKFWKQLIQDALKTTYSPAVIAPRFEQHFGLYFPPGKILSECSHLSSWFGVVRSAPRIAYQVKDQSFKEVWKVGFPQGLYVFMVTHSESGLDGLYSVRDLRRLFHPSCRGVVEGKALNATGQVEEGPLTLNTP